MITLISHSKSPKSVLVFSTIAFACFLLGCNKDNSVETITNQGNSIFGGDIDGAEEPCDGGKASICKIKLISDEPPYLDCDGEACNCNMIKCKTPPAITRPPELITLLETAIAQGTVQEFFMDQDWQTLLPELLEDPIIVSKLQTGEYTMFERFSEPTSFFFVVTGSIALDELTPDDVVTVWEM